MIVERSRAEQSAQQNGLCADGISHLAQAVTLRLSSRQRNQCLFLAYCAAMILAYALLAAGLAHSGFPSSRPGDFTIFYTAAHIVRSGHADNLYDLDLQSQVQQRILQPYGVTFADGLLPYNYPPILAVAFVPLSFLSLARAFYVWSLVNLLLVLASVKLLLNHQHRHSIRDFATATLMVLAFFPVFQALVNGQTSFLILLILVLTYLALKHDRHRLAGAVLALGLVKPQLIIAIVGLLLFRRRWHTLLAFGVTSLSLLLASWLLVGTNGMLSYARLLGQMSNWDGVFGFHPAIMPNLRGTAYRIGQLYHIWRGGESVPAGVTGITIFLSAVILILMLRTWKRAWNVGSSGFDLQFGQAIVGGLLLSPHLYGHDLTLLVLVGFLLMSCFNHNPGRTQVRRVVGVVHVAPVLTVVTAGFVVQAQVLALLLIFLVFILARWTGEPAGELRPAMAGG